MATATPSPAAAGQREILIISHSSLFYWWPVWASAFLFALVTLIGGDRMAVVPTGTEAKGEVELKGYDQPRDVLVLPDKKKLAEDPVTHNRQAPKLHVSRSKNLGVLFCIILLLVITITNIPLRGLWSVIVIVFIIFFAIIFAILGWWDNILNSFSLLDIRISMGG